MYQERELTRLVWGIRVPGEEREEYNHVLATLSELSRYTLRFWHALQLFDMASTEIQPEIKNRTPFSDRAKTFSGWRFMASRDAAMAVFHFSKALDAFKQGVSGCATLAKVIDHQKFRDARRKFRADFPNFADVRHAVAHVAELRSTPKSREKHTAKGPSTVGSGIIVGAGARVHISEGLTDRTFTNTYEGKLVTLDITVESLMKLDNVLALIEEAFRPVESAASP